MEYATIHDFFQRDMPATVHDFLKWNMPQFTIYFNGTEGRSNLKLKVEYVFAWRLEGNINLPKS